MIDKLPGPSARDFIWASGIEDTFVPQARRGQRPLEEYELMGHYIHWREDLALARDLGAQALRWGVPWYRVEPLPGEFDWSWTDQVIPYMVEELGITPIIDLMHYGCPFWMRREFLSEEYPQAVAGYAGAFARRYGHLIRWYTPLNEPIVNALMCGRQGAWPPYLTGDYGYVQVMVQLARGIVATVNELKQISPEAIMVHVEAAGVTRSSQPELAPLAAEDQLTRFLCYDLVTGRVDVGHPLYTWLVRNGISPMMLANLVKHPIGIDVLGLNFYPQWSTREVHLNREGRLAYRKIERSGAGFAEMITDYHTRYGAPVIVTETSAYGSDGVRSRWLKTSVAAMRELRARGVPVIGFTWFPMFTMVDWRYRTGRQPVERYYIELGLYKIGSAGRPRWTTTPLVEQYRNYVENPEQAIGDLRLPEVDARQEIVA